MLIVDVSSSAFMGEDFELIARDLRYENPEYEYVLIVFHAPGYGMESGTARAVSHYAVAEDKWGDDYTEEEIEILMEDHNGVDVRAPWEFLDQ